MYRQRGLNELSLEEYNLIPLEYLEELVCAECGMKYRVYENLGRLCCRIHPGLPQYDTRRGTSFFSCCGNVYDSRGCVRSDHREEALLRESHEERICDIERGSTMVVPFIVFQYGILPPLYECILYDSVRGNNDSLEPVKYNISLSRSDKTLVLDGEIDIARKSSDLDREARKIPLLVKHYYSEVSGLSFQGVDGEEDGEGSVLDRGWKSTLNIDESGGGGGGGGGMTKEDEMGTEDHADYQREEGETMEIHHKDDYKDGVDQIVSDVLDNKIKQRVGVDKIVKLSKEYYGGKKRNQRRQLSDDGIEEEEYVSDDGDAIDNRSERNRRKSRKKQSLYEAAAKPVNTCCYMTSGCCKLVYGTMLCCVAFVVLTIFGGLFIRFLFYLFTYYNSS